MARPARAAALEIYRDAIETWLPRATFRVPPARLAGADGVLTWRTAGRTTRYLVVEKRHFRHLDAAVIAAQLTRGPGDPPARGHDRRLLLAPYVRAQQAAVLERAGIDYLDLAGNVHLTAAGRHVHVEGKRPPVSRALAPRRPQRGWVKTVMALLIRPGLVAAPLRTLAMSADVALGTVATCVHDLALRGLLHHHARGRTLVDRPALVALWVQAYVEVLRPRLEERRLQVRVDDKAALWQRLRDVLAVRAHPWALAGADAAERRDHFFRAEETEIYAPVRVFDARDLQKALGAQPAGRGGNLLVIEPPGPLALPPALDAVAPVAPDLLTYAELRYRATGQAHEAADRLLERVLADAEN